MFRGAILSLGSTFNRCSKQEPHDLRTSNFKDYFVRYTLSSFLHLATAKKRESVGESDGSLPIFKHYSNQAFFALTATSVFSSPMGVTSNRIDASRIPPFEDASPRASNGDHMLYRRWREDRFARVFELTQAALFSVCRVGARHPPIRIKQCVSPAIPTASHPVRSSSASGNCFSG
uniref:Secreted protein n=1 Tax=Steinernema glaseri TaxID=37863 RepID=A0A1I7XYW0_9BILA